MIEKGQRDVLDVNPTRTLNSKLFIIPCEKTFQSKYLNDIFMTEPREIVFEGEGGMKRVLKNGYHKVCETHLISFYAKEYSCPLCNPMRNNSNQDALHC